MPEFTILEGDALTRLRELPDESVHCCVTSPPYWGLRDYGTGKWEGGDESCDHRSPTMRDGRNEDRPKLAGSDATNAAQLLLAHRSACGKCGATKVDAQIGLERTPEDYVAAIVAVFREVRRVLRSDGTAWVNLGDSYTSGGRSAYDATARRRPADADSEREAHPSAGKGRAETPEGMKPKDLMGIPWMVAFALRADGWYLRSEIIWHKPNPMPESVTDRPTKSHEQIFLLAKSERYYYDHEAIKEQATDTGRVNGHNGRDEDPAARPPFSNPRTLKRLDYSQMGRNKRSVWTISTRPYSGAHFATFPPDLIDPCILAGCPPAGKRCDCADVIQTPTGSGQLEDPTLETGRAGMNRPRREGEGTRPITVYEQRQYAEQLRESPYRSSIETMCGPAFAHYIRTDRSGARPLPPELLSQLLACGWLKQAKAVCDCPIEPAGTVLDPFNGAGTTGLVALRRGRQYVGIELNPEYATMARNRILDDSPMFNAEVAV